MEKILFLVHTEPDGTVSKAVLETLPAAQALGGAEWSVGLVGGITQPAGDQLAGCGATLLLAAEDEAFTQSRYATDAAAVEAMCRASGATIILAPHTARWARALPGVAARLAGRVDTHATAVAIVNSVPAVTRWFYRQRTEGVLTTVPPATQYWKKSPSPTPPRAPP
jgi:electron transfer flavoprotein alpha subunit